MSKHLRKKLRFALGKIICEHFGQLQQVFANVFCVHNAIEEFQSKYVYIKVVLNYMR